MKVMRTIACLSEGFFHKEKMFIKHPQCNSCHKSAAALIISNATSFATFFYFSCTFTISERMRKTNGSLTREGTFKNLINYYIYVERSGRWGNHVPRFPITLGVTFSSSLLSLFLRDPNRATSTFSTPSPSAFKGKNSNMCMQKEKDFAGGIFINPQHLSFSRSSLLFLSLFLTMQIGDPFYASLSPLRLTTC